MSEAVEIELDRLTPEDQALIATRSRQRIKAAFGEMRRPWSAYAGAAVLIAIVLSVTIWVDNRDFLYGFLLATLSWLVFGATLFTFQKSPPRRPELARAGDSWEIEKSPWTVRLDRNGVLVENRYERRMHPWKLVDATEETRDGIFLYLITAGLIFVPARTLPKGVAPGEILARVERWREGQSDDRGNREAAGG